MGKERRAVKLYIRIELLSIWLTLTNMNERQQSPTIGAGINYSISQARTTNVELIERGLYLVMSWTWHNMRMVYEEGRMRPEGWYGPGCRLYLPNEA
jgi:hypothetical protein